MDLPPHTSYERILARIEAESRMSEAEGKKVDRRKFHHMHETPETLAFLQEQFEDVIPYARDELGLDIVIIDATEPIENVVEAMLVTIGSRFNIASHGVPMHDQRLLDGLAKR